jgi:hypothetical protein
MVAKIFGKAAQHVAMSTLQKYMLETLDKAEQNAYSAKCTWACCITTSQANVGCTSLAAG